MIKFNLIFFCMAFAVCCTTYNFIDVKPIDFFSFPVTAGTFLVAVSYIINDCITELYGRGIMIKVLLTTICLHLMTILAIQLACVLPPYTSWTLNDEFISIIGQSPKVALLSAFAFLCGTSTNAYVMDKLKHLWNSKYFKWRAFLSTVAGEFIDCCAFFPFMFYGILSYTEIIIMVIVHTAFKCILEVCVLPITQRIVNYYKS